MNSNLLAFAMFAALEIVICGFAALVMIKGKDGWGWLILIAVLLMFAIKIKS